MDQARSSAQQKALFKAVQECSDICPCQLLLDMKVCCCSTYVMLNRAESWRQVSCFFFHLMSNLNYGVLQAVDEFVCELRLKETNNKKQHKLAALGLDEEEWTCVCLFCNVLQVCVEVMNYSDNSKTTPSACGQSTTHFFDLVKTNTSQCTAGIGETVCRVGEGLKETTLQCFCASAHGWLGKG
jgi:hypothetical protein